jgi:hypothetical protein
MLICTNTLLTHVSVCRVLQAEQLAVGRLGPGALYNESVLYSPAAPLPAHLVARVPGTTVVCFELSSVKQALGAPGKAEKTGHEVPAADCRARRLLWAAAHAPCAIG